MSKGLWKICPLTGVSLAKLRRSDVRLVDDDKFDVSVLPDCDVFDVSSFAALCGFSDVAYFRDIVLRKPGCPIHFRRNVLKDESTGRRIGDIYATRTMSAVAGGQMWRINQLAAARTRARSGASDISSGSNIR